MKSHYVFCNELSQYLVFLLSNNHINNIITAPLDFQDEDIVSQYISFMKMLSLSVNENTIHFFTNNVFSFFLPKI